MLGKSLNLSVLRFPSPNSKPLSRLLWALRGNTPGGLEHLMKPSRLGKGSLAIVVINAFFFFFKFPQPSLLSLRFGHPDQGCFLWGLDYLLVVWRVSPSSACSTLFKWLLRPFKPHWDRCLTHSGSSISTGHPEWGESTRGPPSWYVLASQAVQDGSHHGLVVPAGWMSYRDPAGTEDARGDGSVSVAAATPAALFLFLCYLYRWKPVSPSVRLMFLWAWSQGKAAKKSEQSAK